LDNGLDAFAFSIAEFLLFPSVLDGVLLLTAYARCRLTPFL
jgi:hypothetical protein